MRIRLAGLAPSPVAAEETVQEHDPGTILDGFRDRPVGPELLVMTTERAAGPGHVTLNRARVHPVQELGELAQARIGCPGACQSAGPATPAAFTAIRTIRMHRLAASGASWMRQHKTCDATA